MTGCSFADTHEGITSWGWRGERRLWRVRRPEVDGQIEWLSYAHDPCDALLQFLERVRCYEEGDLTCSFD